MGRTVPSPAWASNVCFNSCWIKLFVSLSLSSLFVWRNRTKIVDFMCRHHDPFFQYIKRNLGEYLWKHASAQIMGFRCEGLGSCNLAANNYRHLLSLDRKVAVLQAANSSGWDKLKWGKNLLEKYLSVPLDDWFVCSDSSLKSVPGC